MKTGFSEIYDYNKKPDERELYKSSFSNQASRQMFEMLKKDTKDQLSIHRINDFLAQFSDKKY